MAKESKKQKAIRKITFDCPEEIAKRLDKLVEISDVPRSRLVLNMVKNEIEFLEATKKVGILNLSLLLRDAGEKLKEVGKKWKDKKSINDLTKEGEV